MSASSINQIALRAVLALLGVIVVFVSLNLAFGGIMGLDKEPFLTVTQPDIFAVEDNHVRFVAALFLSSGLFYLAAAIWPVAMRSVILATGAAYFIGGLVRLVPGDFALVFGPDILVSFLFEILVFPLAGIWLYRTTR